MGVDLYLVWGKVWGGGARREDNLSADGAGAWVGISWAS